jgi:ligand-binding sensor domain-containing protein/anti-sigma regulatory factor (Ser/Thr protein kinase)
VYDDLDVVPGKCLILFSLALAATAAGPGDRSAAAEYSHRIWRIEDGLPQNRIRTLAQTPDGYLWIGTSEGLARFDGARFTVFDRSNTPALADDGILSSRLTSDGSLWIGTEGGGLVRYQGGEFRHFGPESGLTNGFVRAIFEDRSHNLWIGTDRGFFRRQGDRFVRLDNTREIPLATVPSIAQDENGQIWVVSPLGLLRVQEGKLVRSTAACDTTHIRSLRPALDRTLWAAETMGGGKLKSGCVERDPHLPEVPLRPVVEDRDGNTWVGTEGHGLFRIWLQNGQVRRTPFAESILPGNTVNAILEDRERNLWMGCEDGLLRLSRSSVVNVGSDRGLTDHGLADEDVLTVYSARSGELWVATVTGQVYSISDDKATRRQLPGVAANLPISTVYEDRSGAFWFGTASSGIVRLVGGRATLYTKESGLRNGNARQILDDGEGHIWFALASGIARWDGTSFRNYYLEDGLSYPSTRCLLLDRNGDVLVGTDAGMNRIHNGEIVHDGEFSALSGDSIWSMYQDAAGTLWLGSRGAGLLRFRAGSIARFDRSSGLMSNTIAAILADREGSDPEGRLWMSTSAGVASASRRELDAAAEQGQPIHITPYGPSDGMATSQMNGGIQPAAARTASGDLWFASVKGAVRIRPVNAPGRIAFPVLIEKIEADSRTIPLAGTVRIPPGHGRLQIDFTLCDLVSPQRVSFRYKLESFDENWTLALRNRSANYTNVPPGDYTFHVIASETGSPSSASEAVLKLRLEPAFYQTSWFIGLLVLGVAGAVWGGFAFFARQTRSRYQLLLAERTRLAREMHDTVIQGCVGVSTLLEASAGFRTIDKSEADKLIDQARLQATRTLEEARDAVWDLRHPQPAESAVAVLFDLARGLAAEHRIEIDTRVEGSGSPDRDLERTILFVGREALGNAITHAKPARIGICVSYTPFDVSLEVTDDGIGFDARRQTPAESRHFGLIGMRERVETAGGSFRIESRPGEGTKVLARIPTVQQFHAGVP